VAWSSEPKKSQAFRPAQIGDRRARSLWLFVRGEPAVFEEARERLLLPSGVAEGRRDQTAHAFDALVLPLGPGEEVVDERTQPKLTAFVPLLRRKTRPLRFELEDRAKAEKPFARRRIFGDGGGLPKPSAAVGETAHFRRRLVVRVRAGFAAEQGVVDRVRVGLDVSGEAPGHLGDGLARVLALVLEEDMVLVGQDDEEVSFPTGLSLAGHERLGLDADTGRVGRQAEGALLRFVTV
jgi:hypothetical protein